MEMGHQGHTRFLLAIFSGELKRVVLWQTKTDLCIFINKNMVKTIHDFRLLDIFLVVQYLIETDKV